MLPHGLDVIGEKYPKPQEDSMETDRMIESPPSAADCALGVDMEFELNNKIPQVISLCGFEIGKEDQMYKISSN